MHKHVFSQEFAEHTVLAEVSRITAIPAARFSYGSMTQMYCVGDFLGKANVRMGR